MTPYVRLRIDLRKNGKAVTSSELVKSISGLHKSGKLQPGSRLPPVRVLAHQIGLSKNTIHSAYEELISRGVIEGKSRQGFFIYEEKNLKSKRSGFEISIPELVNVAHSTMKTTVTSRGKSKFDNKPIQLGSVFIDRELLPMKKISECFRSCLNQPGLHYLYELQGYAPLRQIIAERLKRRGIPAEAGDVIITTGSQQALDIVSRSLKKRSIATENPAYGIGKLLFETNQMKVTGLPLNPFDGIDLNQWENIIQKERPSALYLTTNFHNPTGFSYSSDELNKISEMSSKYGFGIIEDDWGSDMLPFSEYQPPLRSLCGENVFYMNSFTKKLLPSLRIGYLLANSKTRDALLTSKRVATLGNPTLIEAALFEFLDRGYYDTHLKHLQSSLNLRYQNCLNTLKAIMPQGTRWTEPGGGPVLWLEVPKQIKITELYNRCQCRGVILDARISEWFFGEPHLHGLKIGFAQESEERMSRGLEILAEEMERFL